MSPNRKAELQRKLSLAPVPRPPAGLLERIKSDIPAHLQFNADKERARFSRSVFFNVRVAASILLVVSSAYVCLHLLSRDKSAPRLESTRAEATAPRSAPAPSPSRAADSTFVSPATTNGPVPSAVSTQQEFAPEAVPSPLPETMGRIDTRRSIPPPPAADDRASREDVEGSFAAAGQGGGVVGGAVGGIARDTVLAPMVVDSQLAAPRPQVAAANAAQSRSASSGAPASPVPVERSRESRDAEAKKSAIAAAPEEADRITVTASAPAILPAKPSATGVLQEARAEDLVLDRPDSLFGISVEAEAFDRIRSAIERGQRPAAGSINVDGLTNYFAGGTTRPPHEVKLEAEGSPLPQPGTANRLVLHFSVDTATAASSAGTTKPIASNARLAIDFEEGAVAHYRRLGGTSSTTLPAVASLLRNSSVTAVYEIELKPRTVRSSQRLVTVRLHYRSMDGTEQTLTRTLTRRDVAASWTVASRRHRLASLAAIWGESLQDRSTDTEIALRAEELSRQEPGDSRARELATAATAYARIKSGSSTGSAR